MNICRRVLRMCARASVVKKNVSPPIFFFSKAKKFVEDCEGRRKADVKIDTRNKQKENETRVIIKRTLRLSESLRSPRPRRWLSHLSVSPTLDRWFPRT